MYTFRSDKIVILDTEYTSREWAQDRNFSGPNEFPEIIQVAAILVDTKTFEEIDHFISFVKPSYNPILSDFIKNLTHITQEQVDAAENFITVFDKFKFWAHNIPTYSFGNDGFVVAQNYWLHKKMFPFSTDIFKDIRDVFWSAKIPAEKYTSWTINKYFGIENLGTEHDALADVRNILRSLEKMYLG